MFFWNLYLFSRWKVRRALNSQYHTSVSSPVEDWSIFLVVSKCNMPSRAAIAIQLVSPSGSRETVIDALLVGCLNAVRGKIYFHSFDTCLLHSAELTS